MKAFLYSLSVLVGLNLIGCSDNTTGKSNEDILVGDLNVSVDNSILPIFLEQKDVFESSYVNAKINPKAEPEVVAINNLLAGKSSFAVLTRTLTDQENKTFKQRSITPRIYPVAYDAIVVLGNVANIDTSITKVDIINLLKGNKVNNITLVFDDLNSSILRYFKELGKLDKVANTYVNATKGSQAVLEEVVSDKNKVGLISFNQYLSLKSSFSQIDKIRILSVLNDSLSTPKYVKPSQASISTNEYPFKRTIYVLNYQPNLGLGIGFSSFITGDRGQRIVLKSGLLPATMPGREIIVRDGFN